MIATVLRPAALVVILARGKLLAVADCRDSAAGDTERHQIILRGLRAFCAERDIVLLGAALIAMPLDLNPALRVGLQPARVGAQHRAVLRLGPVLIVREMDNAQRTTVATKGATVLELLERRRIRPADTAGADPVCVSTVYSGGFLG